MPDTRPKLIEMATGHRTKAEIELRKKGQEALYTGEKFGETQQVKDNPVAHKEFLRLRRLYDKIPYVDALDQGAINRYCLEVSNRMRLAELSVTMEARLDGVADMTAAEVVALYKALSNIQTEQRKSEELLIKLEDRLLLNPTSRIRAVPKTPEKAPELSGVAAFRAKRVEA